MPAETIQLINAIANKTGTIMRVKLLYFVYE